MADLEVSYEVLDDSERRLSRLKSEFDHIDHQKDELRGIWGSGAVAGAMGNFVDNWSYHRKKLIEEITSVGKMVSDSRDAFRGTDGKLAQKTGGKG